jgi:hypothetical protein
MMVNAGILGDELMKKKEKAKEGFRDTASKPKMRFMMRS